MRFTRCSLGSSVVFFLAACGFASGENVKPQAAGAETAAEKLRKALDQVRDLEIANQALDAAVNQLREQTGINFAVDPSAVVSSPFAPNAALAAGSGAYPQVQGQFHNQPVRAALIRLLRPHNLTHVLVGDTVLITSVETATQRQLEQPVSVNAEALPLSGLLKQLSRETGANLILDPRAAKEGQTPLSLRLDEVPLQTAVEVLADEVGLRMVRMDNVLYVTSEKRAEKLRKPPAPAPAAAAMGWQIWPDGQGGFRLTPPATAVPAMGGAGIGGIGGLGGIGGISGLGGGGFNQLGANGGFQGRANLGGIQPVPLTPPLSKAKQPAPDKPKSETPPPAKPAVKPAGKDKPASKDKPQAQATPTRIRSSRIMRRRSV